MAAQVRFSRLDVTDRFPTVSLKIRDEGRPSQAEVAIGTDPTLFTPEGKEKRNAFNFYSTRGNGAVHFVRDEANFFVPPEVIVRFIGNEKLYIGVATAGQGGAMKVAVMPTQASPYISIKGLSGRGMARVRVIPNRQQRATGYGRNSQAQLEWAGDTATPGMTPVANGGAAVNGKANGASPPAPVPYDDGFGPMPGETAPAAAPTAPAAAPTAQGLARQQARSLDRSDDPEAHGIEGPAYSEVAPYPAGALSVPTPDYPRAARFVASPAFNAGRSGKTIDRIVIHITDAPTTSSTVNHFSASGAQASAHYLVGQDGEVVQFVAETDTAWHARGVNSRSIGIEHVAIKRGGADYPRANGTIQHFDHLPPSDTQYCESAALVSYLCDKYGLTPDRTTIIGHREADPGTTHTSCPEGAWNWDHFMDLVINRYCAAQPIAATAHGLSTRARSGGRYKPVSQAMVVGLEDRQKARKYGASYRELFQWPVPTSVVRAIEARGFKVQTIDAAIGDLNLDRYPVAISRFPNGWDAPSLLQHFIRNINQFIDTDLTEFSPYDESDAEKLASSDPKGAVFKLDLPGPDNAAVVISAAEPMFYIVTTISTPWSGDHPVSGHRQFGYIPEEGKTTFYTRGADRATLGFPGTETAIFYGSEKLWQSFQRKLAAFINDNGGAAEIIEPFSERFNATAMREEFGRYDVAHSLATTRAMSTGAFTVNWDEVELIPQPTNSSCWAAAGAMLVGWRDRVSLTPDTVAQACKRSTASGLLTDDNSKFAAEMGFVAVPPVCYSEEGFCTLLGNNGPLWVSEGVPPNLHAIIVTGMYSDGSNTYVRIADPWDRVVGTPGKPGAYVSTHATGSRYIMSWDEFTRQYEAAMTGDPPNRQILHSGNPNGLVPNTGATSPPPGYAMSANGNAPNNGDGKGGASVREVRLRPPPPPRARGMNAAGAEVLIGDAPVETVHGSQGNVSWKIDHFHGPKHPGNVAPASGGAYSDAPTIRLDQWPVLDNERGATSAWFTIDWLYDGRSIGDVRISNAGVNAGASALVVRGQIVDDSALYPPNDCASLTVRLTYQFQNDQTGQTAVTEVRIYGDGTHEINSQRLEPKPLALGNGALPARAMDGGVSTVATVVSTAIQLVGGQSIASPSWLQTKHPGDTPPPGVREWKMQHKSLTNVPWATGPLDKMTAYFDITWEYDGLSLRNVHFYPSVNSAILGDIQVSVDVIPREARQSNIFLPGSPMVAAVDLQFTYRFVHKVDDDETAVHRATIYGDGGFWQNEKPEWIHGGFLQKLAL